MPLFLRIAEIVGIWLALAGVICIFYGFRLQQGSRQFAIGVAGIWLVSLGMALAFALASGIVR